MNQNDLRVIKTKKNIEASFIYLLGQKDFYKITVQDILDKALINRSTFYKHYTDKYQLAQILCDSIFALFKSGVTERFDRVQGEDIFKVIKPLYKVLGEKREEVLALYTINTETIHLYMDMSDFLKESYYKHYKDTNNQPIYVLDYLSTLYAALVMNAIKWCLQNDGYEKMEEHSQLLLKFAEAFEYPSQGTVL